MKIGIKNNKIKTKSNAPKGFRAVECACCAPTIVCLGGACPTFDGLIPASVKNRPSGFSVTVDFEFYHTTTINFSTSINSCGTGNSTSIQSEVGGTDLQFLNQPCGSPLKFFPSAELVVGRQEGSSVCQFRLGVGLSIADMFVFSYFGAYTIFGGGGLYYFFNWPDVVGVHAFSFPMDYKVQGYATDIQNQISPYTGGCYELNVTGTATITAL